MLVKNKFGKIYKNHLICNLKKPDVTLVPMIYILKTSFLKTTVTKFI